MLYSTLLQYAHDKHLGEPLRDGRYFSEDGRSCAVGAIVKEILGNKLSQEDMLKIAKASDGDAPKHFDDVLQKMSKVFICTKDVGDGFEEAALRTLDQMCDLYDKKPLKSLVNIPEYMTLLGVIMVLNDGMRWDWGRIIVWLEDRGL